ncbi:hypothetical protein CROQUDRAFT_109750 [Cronartium quercuum f. sp. fusiforme G11]|uniref:Uncharacterized protein n=1 Tax=Cronartium quercuum f. sp. fusiforme G11 TaxID=708437 RepID=A0A9P6T9I2_9BASI|nr:hypothetical protein CROQUDRAFT_109750 [Cronartium quercuum f. sp. fusiforme G11]
MIQLIQIITLSLLLAFTFAKPVPPRYDVSGAGLEKSSAQIMAQTPEGGGSWGEIDKQ